MGLVSRLSRLGVDTANGVDEVDASHPFVDGKLDFSSKIVNVSNQGTEDHPVSLGDVRAHGFKDMLSEGRVKSGGFRGLRRVRHTGSSGSHRELRNKRMREVY